jgi:Ca2+-binding EF-hand superfamily protein
MEVDFMRKQFLMSGALALGLVGLCAGPGRAQNRPAGDIPGPIDSIQDLKDTAKMLFKMADTNNDGQISQKEAIDVGNLLVGGFFFRADANGDGVLTPEEARAAREQLFQQQPLLRYVLQKAMPNGGGTEIGNAPQPGQPASDVARNLAANPARTIGSLLDINHDQKIQASELRQAVQQSVQTLFTIADANQDGQLSPAELNRAVGEAARTALQVSFQAADTDHNGALSQAEFDKALTEPAHAVFRVLDGNNDGQISLEELQRAQQVIADQIRRLGMPGTTGSMRGQSIQDRAVAPAGTIAPAPGAVRQP